jgi:hypothetical protein
MEAAGDTVLPKAAGSKVTGVPWKELDAFQARDLSASTVEWSASPPMRCMDRSPPTEEP